MKSNGVLDCECQREQTEGDGLEKKEGKAQEQRKGECAMADYEYFRASCVLSVIIAAFDSPLDVSVPTSKESRR